MCSRGHGSSSYTILEQPCIWSYEALHYHVCKYWNDALQCIYVSCLTYWSLSVHVIYVWSHTRFSVSFYLLRTLIRNSHSIQVKLTFKTFCSGNPGMAGVAPFEGDRSENPSRHAKFWETQNCEIRGNHFNDHMMRYHATLDESR